MDDEQELNAELLRRYQERMEAMVTKCNTIAIEYMVDIEAMLARLGDNVIFEGDIEGISEDNIIVIAGRNFFHAPIDSQEYVMFKLALTELRKDEVVAIAIQQMSEEIKQERLWL